ncbi:LPXTG-motif cell wall-anchored protein [Streptomyces sp. SAI-208]|jgi:LPXTG-motif cell wall-anchored protein|uniref:LPXTG cell wall anchor domain-containing protein n=1 Tax=unclassified Streptomyces TaxID=2593676 RepID=UPI002473D12C|nr:MULTISPECIES: LPXTG cell wall anchor domain-containing protein [unclassified Streptomyces]MDH6517045.1 LPXTG-motif cell wall-anchored protein [Streptomyces sp. SAI-090]MDH6549259.1 LPXTG-motif cell wall-anchored protein [Streptomyces sp. SAI-041]MDH6568325.1 LPXTG-motif cell wall-anchored protein [Streptomyces sp. SAI-117]MDH6586726.1 LPXTG-motif cell wall-anchored protein [Streptomyces sp. SAI-133]MDH6607864.1 LPXTG-motif cell wall-anchored protein [Streptomyces sp. SAI-208]
MKLRRALAAAAATAAIAPLALFAAPSAFAEESPTPTAAESTPAGENTPTAPESTTAAPETTPAAPETTPATGESSPAAGETSSTPSGSPSTSPSGSTSASPSPSTSDEPVDQCEIDEDDDPVFNDSDVLHSSLTGLPESIVAGSGWTNFKFNVSNSGDETIKDIQPIVGVGAVDWDFEKDYTDLVTVQVKQGGSWVDVATQFGEGGSFNAFDLKAGDSLSYQLRVKVDREVPSAIGIAIGLAEYSDDKGCWVSADENMGIYYFEVLPAGSDAGKPGDAKPQTGGKSPISDVNGVDVDGQLAETGSSSALPVLGLVGGFAVVAGTGVVFAVKRRKGAAGAHA